MIHGILSAMLATGICLPAQASGAPQIPVFDFANAEQGQAILTRRDDFITRLSPFDRAARLKSNQPVSEKTFLNFVANSVQPWPEDEKKRLLAALSDIQPALAALALPWPEQIYLIRSNGHEEGGAAYTRGNAVILPAGVFARSDQAALSKLMLHELFHVLSRRNPALKAKLYAAIGFRQCGEIAFPPALLPQKITNPDAPINDYCIQVQVAERKTWVIPLLLASQAQYDPEQGGEFFDYMQFRFLLVEVREDHQGFKAEYAAQKPQLVELAQVSGFFEQVGTNTDYILHPEEILADNFALLMLKEMAVPSPQLLKKMQTIFNHECQAD